MNAALILARTDSSRFPNKVISELGGKKLIQWCIDGILNVENIEPILVTSDRDVDLPLVEVAQQNKIKFFQGDFENIAKRVLDCIHHFDIDLLARINGDSPFVNRSILEEALGILGTNPEVDFVTNLIPRRFPYGLSVEIMRSKVFEKSYSQLNTKAMREHITTWFYQNTDKFNIHGLEYPYGNDHDIRFTVDTFEDHKNIEEIILNNPTFDFHNAPINEIVAKFKMNTNLK